MSPLPSDSGTAPAIARLAEQLTTVTARLDALHERLGALVDENSSLRAKLEHSEAARADLVAQAEHMLHLLAESRREVRDLHAKPV